MSQEEPKCPYCGVVISGSTANLHAQKIVELFRTAQQHAEEQRRKQAEELRQRITQLEDRQRTESAGQQSLQERLAAQQHQLQEEQARLGAVRAEREALLEQIRGVEEQLVQTRQASEQDRQRAAELQEQHAEASRRAEELQTRLTEHEASLTQELGREQALQAELADLREQQRDASHAVHELRDALTRREEAYQRELQAGNLKAREAAEAQERYQRDIEELQARLVAEQQSQIAAQQKAQLSHHTSAAECAQARLQCDLAQQRVFASLAEQRSQHLLARMDRLGPLWHALAASDQLWQQAHQGQQGSGKGTQQGAQPGVVSTSVKTVGSWLSSGASFGRLCLRWLHEKVRPVDDSDPLASTEQPPIAPQEEIGDNWEMPETHLVDRLMTADRYTHPLLHESPQIQGEAHPCDAACGTMTLLRSFAAFERKHDLDPPDITSPAYHLTATQHMPTSSSSSALSRLASPSLAALHISRGREPVNGHALGVHAPPLPFMARDKEWTSESPKDHDEVVLSPLPAFSLAHLAAAATPSATARFASGASMQSVSYAPASPELPFLFLRQALLLHKLRHDSVVRLHALTVGDSSELESPHLMGASASAPPSPAAPHHSFASSFLAPQPRRGPVFYLVTPSCPVDLRQLVSNKHLLDTATPFSLAHIRKIMHQLLCAVAYLHRVRVVHHNLTPSSIQLMRSRVMLTQFDHAYSLVSGHVASGPNSIASDLAGHLSTTPSLRAPGASRPSTPPPRPRSPTHAHAPSPSALPVSQRLLFASPEMLRLLLRIGVRTPGSDIADGAAAVNAQHAVECLMDPLTAMASDLWSVGCVLFYLLAGTSFVPPRPHIPQLLTAIHSFTECRPPQSMTSDPLVAKIESVLTRQASLRVLISRITSPASSSPARAHAPSSSSPSSSPSPSSLSAHSHVSPSPFPSELPPSGLQTPTPSSQASSAGAAAFSLSDGAASSAMTPVTATTATTVPESPSLYPALNEPLLPPSPSPSPPPSVSVSAAAAVSVSPSALPPPPSSSSSSSSTSAYSPEALAPFVDLLLSLLRYDPHTRPTAHQALHHALFDGLALPPYLAGPDPLVAEAGTNGHTAGACCTPAPDAHELADEALGEFYANLVAELAAAASPPAGGHPGGAPRDRTLQRLWSRAKTPSKCHVM